jgi:hypothetical protein
LICYQEEIIDEFYGETLRILTHKRKRRAKKGIDDPCSTCRLKKRCRIKKSNCKILKVTHPCKICLVRASCTTIDCQPLEKYVEQIARYADYYDLKFEETKPYLLNIIQLVLIVIIFIILHVIF